jgi:hypothetical protein
MPLNRDSGYQKSSLAFRLAIKDAEQIVADMDFVVDKMMQALDIIHRYYGEDESVSSNMSLDWPVVEEMVACC